MKEIILEIRAAEGGNDSKLLVKDLMDIYVKSAKINNYNYKIKEEIDGFSSIWIQGKDVEKYKNETGSHCFVRIPPTEKYNRTQTSIITVAIIDPTKIFEYILNKNDVKRQFTRSRGSGGQHVNKTSSCCVLTHLPTGIQVRAEDTRVQAKNEEIAWERLYQKLKLIEETKFNKNASFRRSDQIGSGSRGNKRRTYRLKENLVIDHITYKEATFKDIQRGRISLLY
jgi:peptide chain release factor 1